MQVQTLIIFVFALAIGASVALLAWLLTRSIANTPNEDRQYKDSPPLGYRMAWPLVQWLSHIGRVLISKRQHQTTQAKLAQSGLDYSLSAAQFIAGRWLLGALMALLFSLGLLSLENDGQNLDAQLYIQVSLLGMLAGYAYPAIWLNDQLALRRRDLIKSLPFFLDIITLCVEAGLNLQGALGQAVNKGPNSVMRDELQRVMRDIRAGKPRADSLRAMADRLREPSVSSFCSTVIRAESMGMNLGPVLRAQAEQRRAERFIRAEKLAMQAPVKMLMPLIMFIFPCTFIVLFFPIAMKFMHSGF